MQSLSPLPALIFLPWSERKLELHILRRAVETRIMYLLAGTDAASSACRAWTQRKKGIILVSGGSETAPPWGGLGGIRVLTSFPGFG